MNTIPELMEHPQLKARNMLIPVTDDGVGEYLAMGNPMIMSETPAVIEKGAPAMGCDTEKVLLEAGYTADEIAAFVQNEIC